MSDPSTNRNLLFGVLALQTGLIDRGQLVTGIEAWMSEKSRPLGDVLVDQGAVEEEKRVRIDALVEEHVERHDNDPTMTLKATADPVGEHVHRIADSEVRNLPASALQDDQEGDSDATVPYSIDATAARGERFCILRPHKEGGLGKVSVARDKQFSREVALKELKSFNADHPESRIRFLMEAEINGGLEHPGIVPVYAMGQCADGRPFYAMRLIRGDNLKDVIARFHGAQIDGAQIDGAQIDGAQIHGGRASNRDPGERSLEFRKLLGSLVDVCHAIHYAHRRGVLHRDLKPANIVVGKYGETLVIDWGLAKVSDRRDTLAESGPAELGEVRLRPRTGSGSTPTMAGSAKGTPAYMSPEQAEGRLDLLVPATDVYGLGATLFSLLTGEVPVKGENTAEVLEKVRKGDFPKPRKLAPQVPPALEAICINAMALKPDDRYTTPADLAQDIENWLADEPVSVHRDTLGERLGRWARHHRGWAQAVAVTLLAVVVAAVVAAVFIDRARRDAQAAREDAVQSYKVARGAVDFWTTGAADVLKFRPGAQQASRHLFEQAAEDYTRLASLDSDDVELETERGRAYLRLGDVRWLLGEVEESEQAYRAAESLFADLVQRFPSHRDGRIELANSHVRHGQTWEHLSRGSEAADAYSSALDELQKLIEADPDEPRARQALGNCLLSRGSLLVAQGSRQDAQRAFEQAVASFEKLIELEPDEPKHKAGLYSARHGLGLILYADGRNQDASDVFRQATSSFDTLVDEDRENPEYLVSRIQARICLAAVLRRMGRYVEEIETYRESLTEYENLTGRMPDVPEYREKLALTQTDLGQLLHQLGQTHQARDELELALAIFSRLATDYPYVPRYLDEQATARDILGQALGDLGQNRESQLAHELSLDTFGGLAYAFPEEISYGHRWAVTRSHLGQALHKLGEHSAAEEAFRAAIKTLEQLVQEDPDSLFHQNGLAFVYDHLGVLLRDVEDIPASKKAFGFAERYWREAVEHAPSSEYSHNLAWFLVNCADPKFRNPQEAIRIAEQATKTAPKNATYRSTLAAAHLRAEVPQTAEAMLRQAIELRHDGNGRDLFFLAMAQQQQGQSDDALASYREGLQWMNDHRPGNLQLGRIQQEAAKLLGLSDDQMPLDPQ